MSPQTLTGWLRGFAEGVSEEGPTEEQIRRLIDVASSALPRKFSPEKENPDVSLPALPQSAKALRESNKKGGAPTRRVTPDLLAAPVPLKDLPVVALDE